MSEHRVVIFFNEKQTIRTLKTINPIIDQWNLIPPSKKHSKETFAYVKSVNNLLNNNPVIDLWMNELMDVKCQLLIVIMQIPYNTDDFP